MTSKAGEKAKKTTEYQCQDCNETMFVEKGEEIPFCPCGGDSFEEVRESSRKRKSA